MLFVFDLDGTLIDSIGDLALAVNRLIGEHGAPPLPLDSVAGMVGEGAGLLVSRAFAAAGVAGDPRQALPRFLRIYEEILPGATAPYPGIPETLHELAGAGPMAVLTNKPSAATAAILDQWGLARLFAHVVGGDGRVPRKPDPTGLLQIAAACGAAPSDTWMIGDSMVDLRTGHAAGARVCLVRYGFGFAGFDAAELRGGEVFADSPQDVPRALGLR